MREIQQIAQTIAALAAPGMKPKELFTEVRKKHPGATKKDVSRAAFMAAIIAADNDPEQASRVHDAAIASRAGDDESAAGEPVPVRKRRRKPDGSAARAN